MFPFRCDGNYIAMDGNTTQRLRDAIRSVAETTRDAAQDAAQNDVTNVVVASNVGGSGRSRSVSVRQRVVQRGDHVEVKEQREERRDA
jgi:hypothetical protein